jgi:hypothetical protein
MTNRSSQSAERGSEAVVPSVGGGSSAFAVDVTGPGR